MFGRQGKVVGMLENGPWSKMKLLVTVMADKYHDQPSQSKYFCISHNIFASVPVFFSSNSTSQSPIISMAHYFSSEYFCISHVLFGPVPVFFSFNSKSQSPISLLPIIFQS
jgi:hypothetical protein